MAQHKRSKSLQSTLFSAGVVLFFFIFIEGIFRITGFEPVFFYRSYSIPSWMEELDPVVLEKYKSFVAGQGFVNEDVYAYKPDLRYGYKLKPNLSVAVRNYSSAFVVDKLPPWNIYSDDEGFRISSDSDLKTEVLDKRLYVLGDSSSFGWGVDYEDSYPSLLVDKLNTISPSKISLKNLSLPGFSSFQGELLLRELGEVKKGDWVIISFGWNDSSPSLQTDRQQFEMRNSTMGKANWTLRQVLLFRWMRSWLTDFSEPALVEKKNIGRRVPVKQYRKNLETLVENVREKGAKPLLVNICSYKENRDIAKQTAKKEGIPLLDFPSALTPFLPTVHDRFPDLFVTYFEAYGKQIQDNSMMVFLFPDQCHPNGIGHGLMADVLFDTLKGEVG